MTSSTASSAISILQIGQIAINVHDTNRAVEFYRDTLGLRLLFTAGKLAFFDCGGVRLMLTPPERPEFDHPASILYFKVADIQAAHARLVERKVKIEGAPPWSPECQIMTCGWPSSATPKATSWPS